MGERRFKELKEELGTMHPVDIVEVLDETGRGGGGERQMILVFRLLAKEEAAEVFTDMDSDMREVSDQYLDGF